MFCNRQAWQKLGAMPPEEAMEKYIELVTQLYPAWVDGGSVSCLFTLVLHFFRLIVDDLFHFLILYLDFLACLLCCGLLEKKKSEW